MSVPTTHLLYLAAGLFALGVLGFTLRRNVIVVLMSIELMLNAANLAFVALARNAVGMEGQIFAFFVMTVAAAEAAVGLAIIIAIFRRRRSTDVDQVALMKW